MSGGWTSVRIGKAALARLKAQASETGMSGTNHLHRLVAMWDEASMSPEQLEAYLNSHKSEVADSLLRTNTIIEKLGEMLDEVPADPVPRKPFFEPSGLEMPEKVFIVNEDNSMTQVYGVAPTPSRCPNCAEPGAVRAPGSTHGKLCVWYRP